MAEVHDCFTPTELVLMEDLGFAERGTAWKEVLAGTFDLDGELPGQPRRRPQELRPPGGRLGAADVLRDAGSSCAARPPPSARSTTDRTLALTHNLGGYPGEMVSFVSVVGTERD